MRWKLSLQVVPTRSEQSCSRSLVPVSVSEDWGVLVKRNGTTITTSIQTLQKENYKTVVKLLFVAISVFSLIHKKVGD